MYVLVFYYNSFSLTGREHPCEKYKKKCKYRLELKISVHLFDHSSSINPKDKPDRYP